jgi:hypothetical protein
MFARALLLAFALTGLVSAGPALAAGSHDHGHADHGAGPTLNKGAKWETDASLRQGMLAIRDDVAATHSAPLSEERASRLADKIHHQIEFMIANCKLPADADGQLHLLLARIIEGVEAMKAKEGEKGLESVVGALRDYGRYFDHPGWKDPA